jgi:hypothetical protein
MAAEPGQILAMQAATETRFAQLKGQLTDFEMRMASLSDQDLHLNLRNWVTAFKDAMLGHATSTHESFGEVLTALLSTSQWITSQGQSQQKLMELITEQLGQRRDPHHKSFQNPVDNKRVLALKILGSKREEFQDWNDKFINAVSSMTNNPVEFKLFFKLLNVVWSDSEDISQDLKGMVSKPYLERVRVIRKSFDRAREEFNTIQRERPESIEEFTEMHWNQAYDWLIRNLEGILSDKTEGQSASRVKLAEGHGLMAYFFVHQWFTQITGSMLQDEFKKVVSPIPLGKDDVMFDQLEIWERTMDRLSKYGSDYKLNDVLKLNALEIMMSTRKEYYESVLRVKSSVNKGQMFKDVLDEIKGHAFKRRAEHFNAKNGPAPMRRRSPRPP